MQEGEGGAEAPQAAAKTGKGKASKKAAGKAADKAAASKADKAAEQQRQAELELLMMDDSALQDVARIGEHKPFALCTVETSFAAFPLIARQT